MTKTDIPSSDAEVFKNYYPLLRWHVARAGISSDRVEDYSMMLMETFIKNGVREDYDPSKANFRTFISGFAQSYLRHYRERDQIETNRSFFSTNKTVGDNDILILDIQGYCVPDPFEDAELKAALDQVRSRIPFKRRLFFDFVLLQVEEYGKIDVGELSELFEVTRASIHNWMKALRPFFAEFR